MLQNYRIPIIKRFIFLLCLTITVHGLPQKNNVENEIPIIIKRSDWGARPPKNKIEPTEIPTPYVIIHHSASDTCTNKAMCQAKVRTFQNYHMDVKNWSDIAYNFVVGEDGNVYEGRGWDKTGAHAIDYNHKSIGICVIGNYENHIPNSAAIKTLKNLISFGVTQRKISTDYSLKGHKQVSKTACPGNKLYELIKTWQHWTL